MTPEQIELAQRLAADPTFKWMPGMSYRLWSDILQNWRDAQRLTGTLTPDDPHTIPVLADPATVGCLLALVREAWRSPYAKVTCIAPAFRDTPEVWSCDVGPGPTFHAPTEGEALALAILGAV